MEGGEKRETGNKGRGARVEGGGYIRLEFVVVVVIVVLVVVVLVMVFFPFTDPPTLAPSLTQTTQSSNFLSVFQLALHLICQVF